MTLRETVAGAMQDIDEDRLEPGAFNIQHYRPQADAAIAAFRTALLSDEHEGPLHAAMSSWVADDFNWRYAHGSGEQPTHEVEMRRAKKALTAALAAVTEGGQGE